MILQSLEMVGFKSFAPKTKLEFNDGVTAIVGPNGCGKSNVLDALRWVLGEQSAKALRGGEMADVIFGGTDSRPALGMAEVSLTFTDCEKELGVEWNEVRITRRVYRDGKSEYFLNKASCRLRDIHQLFMDTGIGRSAYSIMEQGKIDAILSSRPEDRRAIFEEAAGITKYKAQKKEALRKLEYTEANLVRVSDIIKEVKRQIGSLQRQAAKARRYQGILGDLRTFDLHLSKRRFGQLSNELNDLRQKLGRSESSRSEGEHQIATNESALAALRTTLAELEEKTAGVRETVQAQKNRIFSAENRISTHSERRTEAEQLIARAQSEIETGEEKIRDQESQIARTDEMLAEMLDLLRTGETQLTQATERVRQARDQRIAVERRVSQLTSEVSTVENRLNGLRGEANGASARREAASARLDVLRAEESASRDLCEEARANQEAAKSRLEAAEAALTSAEAEVEEAQSATDEAQTAQREIESELASARRALADIQNRLEILQQLNTEGKGLAEGTQAVLKGLDDPELYLGAIRGALTNFISVDGDYIPAVEAVLGANLQAVLFKDADVAQAAANALGSMKAGRATLLPEGFLNALPISGTTDIPGTRGRLTNFVRTQPEASPMVERLLAGYWLVDDLAQAFTLRSSNPEAGFVTVSGDVISRDGVVSAGRAGDSGASVLVRKNQIAALESDLVAAQATMDACLAKESDAAAGVDSARERLDAAREIAQAARSECATARNDLTYAERQGREAESRRANFQRESEQLAQTAHQAGLKVTEVEERITQTENEITEARTRLADAQNEIEGARERERAMTEELNELRVRVATERQQQESLSRQRGPMAARVAELADLLTQRQRDIQTHTNRIASLDREVVEFKQNIGTWQILLESGEQEIANLTEQRNAAVAECDKLEETLRESRRALASLQDERAKIEVRCTQLEMRIENVTNHVTSRYQLDLAEFRPDPYGLAKALSEREKRANATTTSAPDAADPSTSPDPTHLPEEPAITEPTAAVSPEASEPTGEIDWAKVEEWVRELTGKIDSMGPVNLDAIQEYDELEERHQFLEKQNADLINSKAELLEVISKINRTTRELFADTFVKIRDNFQEMFRELFGGGKANLVLTDESDPLECGIEIIAKPPGKQLQSISLLSGGEKTMTAVSLLFAIYMVKPSPFCVLDEMDAPLDESNISRFIKILDRFVGQSQFVVITHNKRTIARADTVFGVTMEEHGISKVVSVKFSTRNDDASTDPRNSERSVAEVLGKHGNLHSETEEPALAG